MGLLKFFHVTKTVAEDIQRVKDSILRIKQPISQNDVSWHEWDFDNLESLKIILLNISQTESIVRLSL